MLGKDIMLNYLNRNLQDKLDSFDEVMDNLNAKKVILNLQGKSYSKIDNKIAAYNNLMNALNRLQYCIQYLDFSVEIPDNIEPALSPYRTFCDRYTFYYDEDILNKYDRDEQLQVLFATFFTSYQNYFLQNDLTLKTISRTRGLSIQFMYHIGIIKEKIPYRQEIYDKLFEEIQIRHPNNNIISFPVNPEMVNCMFNKLLKVIETEYNRFGSAKLLAENKGLKYYTYQSKEIACLKDSMIMYFRNPINLYIKNGERISGRLGEAKKLKAKVS